MPFLKIQTNAVINEEKTAAMLKKASRTVVQTLNKPEQYMMVSLETDRAMMFAGTTEPAAFLDLKAIGLPTQKANELSGRLCELVQSELGVPKDRVYINFADVPGHLWGWNGETF
jgi:phenylpyruvate tautomerase PptA (4-oxalocrotonate tautomerase family)